jgi:hypothetical protein
MLLASDGYEIGIGFLGELQYLGHRTSMPDRSVDHHTRGWSELANELIERRFDAPHANQLDPFFTLRAVFQYWRLDKDEMHASLFIHDASSKVSRANAGATEIDWHDDPLRKIGQLGTDCQHRYSTVFHYTSYCISSHDAAGRTMTVQAQDDHSCVMTLGALHNNLCHVANCERQGPCCDRTAIEVQCLPHLQRLPLACARILQLLLQRYDDDRRFGNRRTDLDDIDRGGCSIASLGQRIRYCNC